MIILIKYIFCTLVEVNPEGESLETEFWIEGNLQFKCQSVLPVSFPKAKSIYIPINTVWESSCLFPLSRTQSIIKLSKISAILIMKKDTALLI